MASVNGAGARNTLSFANKLLSWGSVYTDGKLPTWTICAGGVEVSEGPPEAISVGETLSVPPLGAQAIAGLNASTTRVAEPKISPVRGTGICGGFGKASD